MGNMHNTAMNKPRKERKILLAGGAGLVGQNLVVRLKAKGYRSIIVLDKHAHNLDVLRRMHPEVVTELVDLASEGRWARLFEGVDCVVMLQAQIGAKERETFVENTLTTTRCILNAIREYHVPYVVHVSSSVVNSAANDYYIETKREQEKMILSSGVENVVLRPTLMFGWFDRKHLGWLARFMKRIPIFPIPGDGKYLRQPLYVSDFCEIIVSCIENYRAGEIYDITGLEEINYVDMIRIIRNTVAPRTRIVHIPYWLFYVLLCMWAIADNEPPFTVSQLKALVTPDVFDVIEWPRIFQVQPTVFAAAIKETFCDPTYGKVELEF